MQINFPRKQNMQSISFVLLILNYFLPFIDPLPAKSLKFVISIFRHGDRNPMALIPTDTKNQVDTWEGGLLGELTTLGIQQHFDLGKYMKKRYEGFLSEKYDPKEIAVRSTGKNRTITSALANMAGMFPPIGNQIWNKNLPWQPIPVHNEPPETEMLFFTGTGKMCPSVIKMINLFLLQPKWRKVQAENAKFYKFLIDKTGFDKVSMNDLSIIKIFDVLNCERIHNDTHKSPDWATDEVFVKLRELSIQLAVITFGTPFVNRLYSGSLLYELASQMTDKLKNNMTSLPRKYQAYFAHDVDEVSLLQLLKAYDGSFPTYAQLLIFELHEDSNGAYVKLFKKNDTSIDDNSLFEVHIPICGQPCLLSKFYQLGQSFKSKNFKAECGLL